MTLVFDSIRLNWNVVISRLIPTGNDTNKAITRKPKNALFTFGKYLKFSWLKSHQIKLKKNYRCVLQKCVARPKHLYSSPHHKNIQNAAECVQYWTKIVADID